MKNILLIGEYYSENLGDPLLCRTVEGIIKDEFNNINIIPLDLSGKIGVNEYYEIKTRSRGQKYFQRFTKKHPQFFEKFPEYRIYKQMPGRYMKIWCQLNEIINVQKIDLVVFAGGEMFMDFFSGAIYLICKKLKGTKIIFHACGMHALSDDSIHLLKKIFKQKNICSISLRDSYQRFCELFSNKIEVYETYDTALSCGKYFQQSEYTIADYGIGLIENEQYKGFQKELIRYFIKSNKSWKIFVNGSSYDYLFVNELLDELNISKEKREKYLTICPRTADELVKTVTSFNNIISFRMHSQVVAAAFGIPSFGYVWDNKIIEFYNKLGLNHNYAIPKPEYNFEMLFKLLEINREQLRNTAERCGLESKELLIKNIKRALSL